MASGPREYKVRSALTELTLARVRELTREPEAVFWVFVFPILLAGILSLAFRSRPPDSSAGRHRGRPAGSRAPVGALLPERTSPPCSFSPEEASQALARGHVVVVIASDETPSYA